MVHYTHANRRHQNELSAFRFGGEESSREVPMGTSMEGVWMQMQLKREHRGRELHQQEEEWDRAPLQEAQEAEAEAQAQEEQWEEWEAQAAGGSAVMGSN